jgi:polyphosphate kinase
MIEFINRELSWLEFNSRVLEEAQDKNNKLFERLKFLAITCSNLDEFFMVRVAALKDQVIAGFDKKDPAGLTPREQLKQIHDKTQGMVNELYTCFNKLIPILKKEGVYFLKIHELNEVQKEFLDDYFREVIYPVLTPMAVDKSRPFPLLANKSLNIGVLISDKKNENNHIFATVQVPSNLGRFIQ